MSVEVIALVLIGGLVLLLALGMEIAVAMGVMASLGFIIFIDQPQIQIPWTAWQTLDSFTLLAMPLFVFMGTMFANTGVVRSLFEGADKWIGWLPGGLASSVVGASAVFGAMSGSSIAAAAIRRIAPPVPDTLGSSSTSLPARMLSASPPVCQPGFFAGHSAGSTEARGDSKSPLPRVSGEAAVAELREFRRADLPGLASLWNAVFAGGPGFVAVTEDDLARRHKGHRRRRGSCVDKGQERLFRETQVA